MNACNHNLLTAAFYNIEIKIEAKFGFIPFFW